MAVTKGKKGYQQFKNDLAADTIGTLYLFYGEETYLREYYLQNAISEEMSLRLLLTTSDSFMVHIREKWLSSLEKQPMSGILLWKCGWILMWSIFQTECVIQLIELILQW